MQAIGLGTRTLLVVSKIFSVKTEFSLHGTPWGFHSPLVARKNYLFRRNKIKVAINSPIPLFFFSSIAGHPIFDCIARYKTVNYLSGRKTADGAFEVTRVISNKTLSSKLVQQLETYKKNSAACSLRN